MPTSGFFELLNADIRIIDGKMGLCIIEIGRYRLIIFNEGRADSGGNKISGQGWIKIVDVETGSVAFEEISVLPKAASNETLSRLNSAVPGFTKAHRDCFHTLSPSHLSLRDLLFAVQFIGDKITPLK